MSDAEGDNEGTGLFAIPAAGGEYRSLTGSPAGYSLAIAPSGSTLVLTSGSSTSLGTQLVPVSGGSPTTLAGLTAAAFSPTGTQLCANDTAGNLVVTSLTGTITTTLVPAASKPQACTWAP
jgi:hypothetical protein